MKMDKISPLSRHEECIAYTVTLVMQLRDLHLIHHSAVTSPLLKMNSFSKASEAQGWMFRDSLVPPFLRKWLRDKFERPGEMGKLSFQSLGYFFSTRQKNKTTSSPLQENRRETHPK